MGTGKGKRGIPPASADNDDSLLEFAELSGSSDDEAEELAGTSGSDEGFESDVDSADDEVREAIADYATTAAAAGTSGRQASEPLMGPSRRVGGRPPRQLPDGDDDILGGRDSGVPTAQDDDDADLGPSTSGRPEDPGSDSSEDERPNRNTVGDVPLEWYKNEDHVGYDLDGKKIIRRPRKDRLDQLLDRNDNKQALRTIYDEYNDEEVVLSKEELAMVMRIRKGQFPSVDIDPYEPYNDYFTRHVEISSIHEAPEPKRRFIPSKWEEQKIVKLVRAMRKGWLKTNEQKEAARLAAQGPKVYLLWADDNQAEASKTATGLSYIPAAKPKLPGHAESYNPPKEYLPTQEELDANEVADPEDQQWMAVSYPSLRLVPAYDKFIKERFERCLDLYLCPRVRKKRLFIDPETLVPKLPAPQDLRPYPTTLALRFKGHKGQVRSVSADPTGQWLLSGGDDGTLRLWEVCSGRCVTTWVCGASPVHCVAWCPDARIRLVSAVCDSRLLLLPSGVGTPEVEAAAQAVLDQVTDADEAAGPSGAGMLCRWAHRSGGGVELHHGFPLRHVAWHAQGDYFASVAPTGNTQSVLVHQLSKRASQNPFRKNRGRVVRVAFHPNKPFFFVATQNNVRIYNLAKQALAKKLIGGSGIITCLAVHPSGDHVIAGSEDKRLAWYDLDLSTKPYKALRYHAAALRGVAYHSMYPLFASGADDGAVQVFHGAVFADLLSNPLIVPVKILRPAQEEGATDRSQRGILDVAFHPTQPWLFSAGEDGDVCLFCN